MREEEPPFARLEPATSKFHLMPFPCTAGAAAGRHSLGTSAICFTGFCHTFLNKFIFQPEDKQFVPAVFRQTKVIKKISLSTDSFSFEMVEYLLYSQQD